jgi:trehalose/maltose hydrolase-like predicted phosphorylase
VLANARRALDPLPGVQREGIIARLGLRREELEHWEDVSRKLRVPFHDGVISQFQGYEELDELDWTAYVERYADIHRLDRLLEAEGDNVNRYKASKQADVLMLFYLLSRSQLRWLFERLGHTLDDDLVRRTSDYYLRRTSHGSTLSQVVHSWVVARSDRKHSFELFRRSVEADLLDVQGGTTAEGIHLGAMAGTVDLVERGFTGLEIRQGTLGFDPSMPEGIDLIEFRIYYQQRWITVLLRPGELTVTSEPTERPPVVVEFRGEPTELEPGATLTFAC